MYGYGYRYSTKPNSGSLGDSIQQSLSSYYFDGTNNYLNLGNVFNSSLTGANKVFSIGIVFRRLNTGAGVLFSKWGATGNKRAIAVNFRGSDTLYFQFSTDGISVAGTWESTATVTDTIWHEAVLVYNNGVVTVYLDGVVMAGTSTTIPTTIYVGTANAEIGVLDSGTSPFKGWINQVFVTTDVVTSLEVATGWNSGKPLIATNYLDNLDRTYTFDSDTWDGSNWTVIEEGAKSSGASVNMIAADHDNNENPY